MHLEGEHSFTATPSAVWERLNDPDVLSRTTPGLTELHLESADQYRAVFAIKMGPINSNFDGSLQVVDRVEMEGYKLVISVDGKIGTVEAVGTIAMQAAEGGTLVTFAGDAKLTGVLARMGQRVLSGVGRMFTKQFFKALEKELETTTEDSTQLEEKDS